jgi:hypothetical protein
VSNYTQTTSFTPKDSLPTNDPNKTIFGALFDTEFGNIASAIASKPDNTTTASFLNVSVTGSTVPANGVYLPSANTLGVTTNSTQRATIGSAGNWMLVPPSSGVTLTIGSVAGGSGLVVNQSGGSAALTVAAAGNVTVAAPSSGASLSVSGTLNGSNIQQWVDGTTTSALLSATGLVAFGTISAHALQLYANNAARVILGSAGNVTVNAPSSGVTLTVNVLPSSVGINFTDGTVTAEAGTVTSTSIFFGAQTNHALSLRTNNTDRVSITSSGAISVFAPASGNAFAATANAGNPAIVANSGGSYHPLVTQDFANTGTGNTAVGTTFNVGYLEVPQNVQSVNYTCVRSDSGKHIYCTANTLTITIPSNASVPFPIGTVLTFISNASTPTTIAITTDSLFLAGTGATGSRTMSAWGVATAVKIAATSWIISGTGLS